MAKLNDIYAKYQDPRWLNSVREFRHKALRESNRKRPLTGAYYWIPRPDVKNRYDLVAFSDQEFGDTSHYRIWNRFVLPMISQVWEIELPTIRRKLRDCYTALPRGRVIRDDSGFRVVHGNNYFTRGWENKIKKQFNVRGDECRFESDPYEVILVDDLNRFQKLTNRQFNLNGVDPYETIAYTEAIEEGAATLTNDLNKRFRVLIDPSPQAVLRFLDQTNKVLGGWSSDVGTVIWRRDDADHNTVANQSGISRKDSIAFYVSPSDTDLDEDGDPVITDLSIETSEFSGNDDFEGLMGSSLIAGLMELIEQRKSELAGSNDMSMDDLMGSLSGADY